MVLCRSCGIVLVAMLAGELPWDKPVMDCLDFVSWIRDNNYQKSPWCKIENAALSLLRNILMAEPAQRFTVRQIKQSAWFVKAAHKRSAYDQMASHHGNLFSGDTLGSLSQPTYFYLNSESSRGSNVDQIDTDSSVQTISMMSSQLEVTDSQQDCECSQQTCATAGILPAGGASSALRTNQRHIESFSQPISTEDMYLNTQATQQTQTQASLSF